jgi:hypothetical protein
MTPRQHKESQINESDGLLGHWERRLDKCNHLMELMRTCLGLLTLTLQVIILLKLFNVI